ncbi:hypothetical protein C8Q73DRAFT_747544 [Cubamyces lactineus]|nr:hypothetical protein C8Q73DRAFT_747544 [Cubamyces lactineus]
MIRGFLNVVLRYGRPGRGLFGKCDAYFGTVEAQGRGTLHCHMLIWLEGHPSPQRMRDLMLDSQKYQEDMFRWLESIVKCELLGTEAVVAEPGGVALPRPRFGDDHPGVYPAPSVTELSADEFDNQYAVFVNEQVKAFNWHEHTDTCWKYLKRGDRRDDAHCRMRIDGGTEPATRIDEETGAIVIRRLHPRIACYNDVVMFLVKANMDIKHIGSGEAAKALLYYVTDYITKASLSTHVGLAALLCAIQRTDARFGESFYADAERNTRSALMTTVNSMLSRMEISHQQVMSYLVGGGDHYASHRFRVLHYGGFDRLVDREHDEQEAMHSGSLSDDPTRANAGAIDGEESGDGGDDSDEILLLLGEGSIGAVSQQQDYIMRSEDGPFDGMSLYEYVGMAEKITKRSESTRMARRQQRDAVLGRRAEARGAFLPEHAQYALVVTTDC